MKITTDSQLLSLLESEYEQSVGSTGGELSDQRETAMKYYLGEPFGDEVDGRSQVVSTVVSDVIEWMLPSILDVFTSSDKTVVFEAEGPEDEEAAQQQTDYVNYIFNKKNPGFLLLYTFIKDALLSKTGHLKVFWEKTKKTKTETYQELNDLELAQIAGDDNVEILEADTYQKTIEGQEPLNFHDVKIRITEEGGQVKVIAVPPEEFSVSNDLNSLDIQSARFVDHRSEKTKTELLEMDFDRAKVDQISFGKEVETTEKTARRHLSDEQGTEESLQNATKRVTVHESYYRVDKNDKGIAELRKITWVRGHILDDEEIDRIPFVSITPVILTHKFHGLSIADLVLDLQRIKSVILRQLLDNMYLVNNHRYTAVDGQVNLDDLLTSRPGGVVRQEAPGMVDVLETRPFGGHAFGMLDKIDSITEDRTGQSRFGQGLDPDALKRSPASGVNQLLTASQQKLKLITRIFAETGIKDLFLMIHELSLKYQDKVDVVKLRGKWVNVDPREWSERTNMTVHVGIGTGNKDQMLFHLKNMLADQMGLSEKGSLMVNDDKIYSTLSRIVENSGFKDAESYYVDPKSEEYGKAQEERQNQPPPLEEELMKLQGEIEKQRVEQGYLRLELDKSRQDQEHSRKLEELRIKQEDNLRDYEARLTQIEAKYLVDIEGSKI